MYAVTSPTYSPPERPPPPPMRFCGGPSFHVRGRRVREGRGLVPRPCHGPFQGWLRLTRRLLVTSWARPFGPPFPRLSGLSIVNGPSCYTLRLLHSSWIVIITKPEALLRFPLKRKLLTENWANSVGYFLCGGTSPPRLKSLTRVLVFFWIYIRI
jgi:hypothetical protein